MTTIAIKDGVVASDTRMISDHIESAEAIKIKKIKCKIKQFNKGKVIVGGAGLLSEVLEFMDWCEGDGDKDSYNFLTESSLFLVNEEGVWSFEKYYRPIFLGSESVFGTGGAFALGAMRQGATPEEAVKIAIELDANSGGSVYTLRLNS